MNLAIFLIAIMNVFAKLLSENLDAIEIVFYRNIIGLLIVVGIILLLKRSDLFKTQRWKAQCTRAIAGTIGVALMFWAYSLMPMAEVTAIMFTGGIINLVMSAIILNENVGVYRWLAVILGIIGGLVVILPEGTAITPKGTIVALTAAFVGGGIIGIVLRSLGKSEHSLTTVFYFALIGTIVTFPYVLYKQTPVNLESSQWLLIGCGVAGFFSLIIKTQAYRLAESSLLNPVYYVGILWTTLFGWMIWQDWPTLNVFLGAIIIIVSNLIILYREHVRAKIDTVPRA